MSCFRAFTVLLVAQLAFGPSLRAKEAVPADDQLWWALDHIHRYIRSSEITTVGSSAGIGLALIGGTKINRAIPGHAWDVVRARGWAAHPYALASTAIVVAAGGVAAWQDRGHFATTGETIRFVMALKSGQLRELADYLRKPRMEQYEIAVRNPDFRDYLMSVAFWLRIDALGIQPAPVRRVAIPNS